MATALHLHAVEHLDRPLHEVVGDLRRDVDALALAATRAAVDATEADRTTFGDTTEPRVAARAHDDGMAVVSVTWNDDTGRWPVPGRFPFALDPTSPWWHREEERTGWPTITLQVVATPSRSGTRLAILSSRAPGIDMSNNRVDRHRRDRLARLAVQQFLTALSGLLTTTRQPAAA